RLGRWLLQQRLGLLAKVLQLKLQCLVGPWVLLRELHRLVQPLARFLDLAESEEGNGMSVEVSGISRVDAAEALKVKRRAEPVASAFKLRSLIAVPVGKPNTKSFLLHPLVFLKVTRCFPHVETLCQHKDSDA